MENGSISNHFRFNPWKHHLNYIRESLDAPTGEIKTALIQIGDSQMDLYTGLLSPSAIISEISERLASVIKINLYNYLKWLQESGGYRLIDISDGSRWTLRFGEDPVKFIHIHPARNSVNTIRVKAPHLKTAILLHKLNAASEVTLETINDIRKEHLHLPPVKLLKENTAVINIIKLIRPAE